MTYETMADTVVPLAHLGSCHEWNDGCRMIAAAIIQGCLVEPEKPRKCQRVQLRLLAARHRDLLEAVQGEQAEAWRGAFLELLLNALPVITRGPVRAYEKALAFDLDHAVTGKGKKKRNAVGKKYGSHIRDILTTGLIVHVMHDSTRASESRWLGPEKAKTRITDFYRSELPNALFVMSSKEMRTAWRKYQPFAHLAAALLLFIIKKGWSRFRSSEREVWRREIVEFLAYAQYFQDFLRMFGDKEERVAKKQAHVRFDYDLVELPAELQIQPWLPVDREHLTALLPHRHKARKSYTAGAPIPVPSN